MYRQIFNDPDFRGHIFSDREAWIWLISQASHKEHEAGQIMLKRGELLTSLGRLSTTYRWTRSKVRCFLKRLEMSGKITHTPAHSQRTVSAQITICKYDTYQDKDHPSAQSAHTPTHTNTRRVINKNGITRMDNNSLSGKPDDIPYSEIITDLNSVSGKDFKSTTRVTQDFIRARWNEGWRVADFKKVHQNKIPDWLKKPDMQGFIRPQTLYGTKFEGYLNERRTSGTGTDRQNTSEYDIKGTVHECD